MAPLFALLLMSGAAPEVLEDRIMRVERGQPDGIVRLRDKTTGVEWSLGPARGELRLEAGELVYTLAGGDGGEVRLLDNALPLGPGRDNYYAVPHRLGILVAAEGDKPFSRSMTGYRGYSMAMFGAVQNGSALLITWEDPYTDIEVKYTGAPERRLTMSLSLRRSARSIRMKPLGRGGYVEIAKAYREIARRRGLLKTLAEKQRENPRVGELFGAADIKPFAFMRRMPGTRLNKTGKPILEISFTFEECAQLAEHLKNDVGVDRAMLVLNGWINGGYDNRHPDILPAAPEIGGDEGLVECSRRTRALGWLFGLHDNYQDIYHDAPSWDEQYIMKNPDGSLRKGGIWPGGQCWLICSRKSLELARRPQNIPAVRKLFQPDLYFSDTIFAAPPYECFDPRHPLTFNDDIANKKALSDYLRGQFGLFGSEDGREWGVPHADYFEGLLSHKTRFTYWGTRPPHDDVVIPLFHLVYGDAVQIYAHQSDRPAPDNASYVLDHILYAEMPVYDYGKHRYWLDRAQDFQPPAGAERRMIFARGDRFGFVDQFIRNTYEVLSPLNRLTALLPMTGHRFLTADRMVETTTFGSDVRITVNYGSADYDAGTATLPQYGFLVESPTLTAFHARDYAGHRFAESSSFVLSSLDGRVRVYRLFGDRRLKWKGRLFEVEREGTVL